MGTGEWCGGLVLSIGLPLSYAAKLNELQVRSKVPPSDCLRHGERARHATGQHLRAALAPPSGRAPEFPPVMALGATGSDDLAFKLGQVLGTEARAIGVHMVFGPVLDVNSNPLNPIINTRSFGESPELVIRLAKAYIRGARSTGLMSTGKHFPGHGDTDVDSHLDLPTIRADRAHLDSIDLPPFRTAVGEGIDAIMTAHIAVVGVEGANAGPATLSHGFMTGILRDEMHFGGVLFTDAMTMGGVAKRYGATEPLIMALEAGADVLLMPRSVPDAIETVIAAVKSGRLSESRDRCIGAPDSHREGARRTETGPPRRSERGRSHRRYTSAHADCRRSGPAIDHARAGPDEPRSSARRLDEEDSSSRAPMRGPRCRPGIQRHLTERFPAAATTRVDARTTDAEYAVTGAPRQIPPISFSSPYTCFPGGLYRHYRGSTGRRPVCRKIALSGKPIIVISFGSPYLLSAFPSVSSYLLAWGGSPISQRAAALALLGEREINGRLPISVPPVLPFGAGIHRAPTGISNQ